MGITARIMQVLGYRRTTRRGANVADIESSNGGGYDLTPEHYQPTGDDAQPLPEDYLIAVPVPGGKRLVAVGFVDPANKGEAGPGEKRVYARDSEGKPVCWVHLRSDGSITLKNEEGSVTLGSDGGTITESPKATHEVAADGSITGENDSGKYSLLTSGVFEVNGVTIDTSGLITTPSGVVTPSSVVNGVEVDGHTHTQPSDSAGNSESTTDPMQEG